MNAGRRRNEGVALAAVLLLGACGSDPPPSDPTGSTGSSSSTTDGGSTSTGAPPPGTTTLPPTDDDTTFGAGCGPDPCGPCDPGCEVYSLCIASEWMCECMCEPTGTAGPEVCDSLDAALGLWLEESLNPPMDCGAVGPDDDAAAWQALHDCVVTSAAGSSFHGTWSGPDEAPGTLEIGAAGRFTGRYELVWYEVSGIFTLTEFACTEITATADCTVDVGQACLSCVDQAEVAVVCTDE